MSDTTVRHALRGAAAALTRGPEDVTDALATLVADCAAGLGAAAVAVMTRDGDDSRAAFKPTPLTPSAPACPGFE